MPNPAEYSRQQAYCVVKEDLERKSQTKPSCYCIPFGLERGEDAIVAALNAAEDFFEEHNVKVGNVEDMFPPHYDHLKWPENGTQSSSV